MLYLSGSKNDALKPYLADGVIGLLLTPNTGYRLEGISAWAMDNGCFSGRYLGDERYLALLHKLRAHRTRCLFVAAPDVVEDAEATLELFPRIAPELKNDGWPVALVAQDGMDATSIPWGDLDYLFLGGSTKWKLSGATDSLIAAAKGVGKKVHVGRVNSFRRFQHFAALGCDSADGTFLAFGPDKNLPRLINWIEAPRQMKLGRSL